MNNIFITILENHMWPEDELTKGNPLMSIRHQTSHLNLQEFSLLGVQLLKAFTELLCDGTKLSPKIGTHEI